MDVVDNAQRNIDLSLKISLSNREENTLTKGACHNCGESVEGAFCDAECRDDYEQRKKFNGAA